MPIPLLGMLGHGARVERELEEEDVEEELGEEESEANVGTVLKALSLSSASKMEAS